MRILVVLFVPAFLLTQVPVTPASLAITHVTVIDTAAGSARGDMTVVIGGTRILTVGDSSTVEVPRAATVIDGRGKFLIPGLWDMHVHMFNNAVGAGTNNREYSFRCWSPTASLAFGTCGLIRKISSWLVAGTRRSQAADCSVLR